MINVYKALIVGVLFTATCSFQLRYKLKQELLHSINCCASASVCCDKSCKEKGADETLATLAFLAPKNVTVSTRSCCGRCTEGPIISIRNFAGESKELRNVLNTGDIAVLLRDSFGYEVNKNSLKSLQLNNVGNRFLRNGNVDAAIKCYNEAIGVGDPSQEGILYFMRGTAYLQRSYSLRLRLMDTVNIFRSKLPKMDLMQHYFEILSIIFSSAFKSKMLLHACAQVFVISRQLESSSAGKSNQDNLDILIQKLTFLWGVYQFSVFKSIEDLLLATVLLPGFGQAWRRAADALMEIQQFSVSEAYYETAMKLDPQLKPALSGSLTKIKKLKTHLNNESSIASECSGEVLEILKEFFITV